MSAEDMANGAAVSDGAFRVLRWLTFSLFFLFALTSESVGVIIPEIIHLFDLSMTAAGSFHYATMSGIALGGLLLGTIADRIGAKSGILVGLAVFGASCAAFGFTSQFSMFVVLLFVGGLAIAMFKTAALALISDISASRGQHTRLMNLVEGFFGIGAIVGPAMVAWLISEGYSWIWLYLFAAVLCGVTAIMTLRSPFPERRKVDDSASKSHLADQIVALRDPYVLGFSLAAILYVGVETAIYVWMPTVLDAHAREWPVLAAYALSIFFVLRATGRFLGAWLLDILPWEKVIAVNAVLILICFLVALADQERLAVFALPFSGLFMSVIYPTINSKALSGFPKARHGSIAGIVLFFTCISAVVAPLVMGLVSDAYGDPIEGFKVAVGFAILLAAGAVYNLWFRPAEVRLAGQGD